MNNQPEDIESSNTQDLHNVQLVQMRKENLKVSKGDFLQSLLSNKLFDA